MGRIVSANAFANNEVAYLAWEIDGKIKDCLGFEVTRVYLDKQGKDTERRKCAAWVAFKGQRNKHWIPQDTSVWPVQKLSWRDLTLRKRRDGLKRRPDEVTVRYEIRPVGDMRPGLEPVPSQGKKQETVTKRDENGQPIKDASGALVKITVPAYEGAPRPLGYLDKAVSSNPVTVTSKRGAFTSTFTNGILAAQWLRNVLMEDGRIEKNELIKKIENPDDPHRKYLAGDVIPTIREFLERPGEHFLALYELEDKELEELLVAKADRIHVILSNSSLGEEKDEEEKGDAKTRKGRAKEKKAKRGNKGEAKAKAWDVRNAAARARLVKAKVDIQHRMFNNATHIGHNKFVIHVPKSGKPAAVLTGSTNWTSTGVAGQTNNALVIEDAGVAAAFMDYWKRMKKDALKPQKPPFGTPMSGNQQGAGFREANMVPARLKLGSGAAIDAWFSPNTAARKKPAGKDKKVPVPPDLSEVYRLMRQAKEAILFLAFYPGQKGKDCIIGEAVDIGINDRSLLVAGAISSPQAMPNYVAKKKEDGEVVEEGESPSIFDDGNVSLVRASRIDDKMLLGDLGAEQLAARGNIGAIIHDKLVVIDPRLPDCCVILGSHNLGFKASYSNDENFLIVRGDRELAEAYAVHILDVYDHYRFRAIETERKRKGKKGWIGFLDTTDAWQDGYVARTKGALAHYFAKPAPASTAAAGSGATPKRKRKATPARKRKPRR